jgi:TP901 family phage tail tape measure protein
MDALTFIINVKSEGAMSAVGSLKESFARLKGMADSVKSISLVNMVQGLQDTASAIKDAVTPGAQFEQGIADLSAITGVTGKDLEVLSEAARSMGKSAGIGASQAVEAFKLLASNIDIASIGGVKGLKELQKATITLSQAAGTTLPMAADTMSFALNQFQLPVSDAVRVINVLGAGAKYGAAEIPDLAAALKDAGSVAHNAGLSIEQATGAIEVLSQRGLKGSEAGNALRNVLLILQNSGLPGVNLKTQGLAGSLNAMKKYMGNTVLMAKLFGRENINAAQILISEAAAVDQMTEKVTGTNVAFEQADIRTNTYMHTVEMIRAKFDDFKISMFNLTGSFMPWVEVVSEGTAGLSKFLPAIYYGKELLSSTIGVVKILITNTRNMIACLEMATTAQEALNIAWITNPTGVIIAGAALLAGALYLLSRQTKELTAQQEMLNDLNGIASKSIAKERAETDRLFDALKRANPKSKERTEIIKEINDKYPELLKNIDLEKTGAEGIAAAYAKIVTEIDRKARADAAQTLLKDYYEKILTLTPLAEAEKKSNDAIRSRLSSTLQSGQYTSNREGIGLSAATNLATINETQEDELIRLKTKRDDLLNMIKADNFAPGTSTSTTTKKPTNIPNADDLKAAALNSISGDSHAVKNINITLGSLIKENTNVIDKGEMSLDRFEAMLRKTLMNVLNDANYAAQ